MIYISSALMQDFIINLLEENGFEYVEKKNLDLFFSTESSDLEGEVKRAKDLIKATDTGRALYFRAGVK